MTKYYFKYLINGRKAPFNGWKWPNIGKWTGNIPDISPCYRGWKNRAKLPRK